MVIPMDKDVSEMTLEELADYLFKLEKSKEERSSDEDPKEDESGEE